MSTTPPRTWKYLEPRPCSSYKQLFIKGTKLTARQLYGQTVPSYDTGEFRTPEEVAADYSVPLEAVLEAIEYCESNPPEIAADFRREERLMEATGMNHPDYKNNPKKYYRFLTPEERARLDDDEAVSG
jgi:uncharacterized protein (DUF433 family)